jgi:hypothetical protein
MIDSTVLKVRMGCFSGQRRVDRQDASRRRVQIAFGKQRDDRFNAPIAHRKIDLRTSSAGAYTLDERVQEICMLLYTSSSRE